MAGVLRTVWLNTQALQAMDAVNARDYRFWSTKYLTPLSYDMRCVF